jgi:predicted dehydrogenase
MTGRVRTGVVGVGTMGRHHARVYTELPGVDLLGVYDVDESQADEIAARYDTRSMSRSSLLHAVDIVSVAVPTHAHHTVVHECIDHGVNVLVEKPLVDDLEEGYDLVTQAERAGVVLQVGHIERFNPAVKVLSELVPEYDLIALDFQRLGPPIDRDIPDGVILDLMVHDIDILLSLVDSEIASLSAVSARDGQHAQAQLRFDSGVLASLTASRVTQQKVRQLAVTAAEARVNVDFGSQSVEIHRHSLPEYVEVDGDIRDRYESVVERPVVPNGEPLKHELESFVSAVRSGTEPAVTGTDGLNVLRVAQAIERATGEPARVPEVPER